MEKKLPTIQKQEKTGELIIGYKSYPVEKNKISSSQDLYRYMKDLYFDDIEHHESMFLVCLSASKDVYGWAIISKGGITNTIVDTRILFQFILGCNATCFAISHNHPSGNLKPSNSDIKITNQIKEISDFFNIEFLDHIIITQNNYFSFSDEGLL